MAIKTDKTTLHNAITLYIDGYSASSISKIMNLSIHTITKELKLRNISLRYKVNSRIENKSEKIIQMFNDGFSIKKIAETFRYNQSSVGRLLRRHGLKTDKNISQKNKFLAKEMYIDGYSLNKISEILNISTTTIYKICLNQNIIMRPVGSKLDIENGNFFKNLNENSAYMLGLFVADGSLTSSKHKICLSLHYNDLYMIKKFKQLLGLQNKICHNKNMASITVQDKNLFNSIIAYGIPKDRKTYNLKSCSPLFEQLYQQHLLNHFVRGFLDGDGSIFVSKTYFHKISFCGYSEEFLRELNNYICKATNVTSGYFLKRKDTNTWTLSYSGGKKIRTIGNWLYDNSNIYLIRKKEKWEQIKQRYLNQKLKASN